MTRKGNPVHADEAAVPCRASQHETEDLIMTRAHEASQSGCSSRGNLIACASHPRKREHTQVIWERQMWALTLGLLKRLFSPHPEEYHSPTQFSLIFKSEVLEGKYLIKAVFWHWTVHEKENFLSTAEKLLDPPCLSTSFFKTGSSIRENNTGPYISLNFLISSHL